MGFEKLVNELDVKEAARLGMHTRPLTTAQVQQHLQDLGIDPEFGTHSHIRGLSGGQKVKVVLAAAMWNSPHMLVLDEPTNYLDRESLGALAAAIMTYGGGVVMISHHSGERSLKYCATSVCLLLLSASCNACKDVCAACGMKMSCCPMSMNDAKSAQCADI